MTPSPLIPERSIAPLHSLARLAQNIAQSVIQPHPSLQGEVAQRRSQLLAAMSFFVAVIAAILTLNQFALYPSIIDDTDTWVVVVGIALCFGAYFVNRAGHTDRGARLFIAILYFVFVIVPFIPSAQDALLNFAVIPILLTAIFFSLRASVVMTVSIAIAIPLLTVLNPNLDRDNVLWSAQFFVLTSGVIIVFIMNLQFQEGVRRRELEAINDQLRASEENLERRVRERTHELEAATEEVNDALRQAEQANSVKSAFLASMSHELRTPLNAIINFTKFVAKGTMGPVNAEQEEALGEVITSGKHLLNLINDVLDMSKIEAGSLNLFVEDSVDMKRLLKNLLSTAGGLIGEKPILLEDIISNNLPTIKGDRQRIYQILLNIMSNACKFTEQGRITLRAYTLNDEVVIAIEDTGPGIPVEDRESVFSAFKQTTTGLRQGGGTGLGMPISLKLAEAHGGRLWLESEVGRGSTFYVALPIESETLELSIVK